jgi:hypothetical protein
MTTETTETETVETQETTETTERKFTQSELDKIVEKRLAKGTADLTTELEATRARVAELEPLTARVVELEPVVAERDQLKADVQAATLKSVRISAAVDAGLPLSFADRLKGDDADAIKADAASLAETVKTVEPAPSFGGGNQGGSPEPDMNTLIRQSLGG